MTNRYRIPVSTWVNATVDVLADTQKEAIEKANAGQLAPGADWPDTKRDFHDLDIGDVWDVTEDTEAAVLVGEETE